MNIGVGTPIRIADLMDSGALRVGNVERIIIDASHVDQKKRGILDVEESLCPLIGLLNRSELKERYTDELGSLQLLFF